MEQASSISTHRVLRVGHRGAAGYAPENTLAAVRKAIELGADYVEVDIQATVDQCLVAMHDKFIDRTTDGTGKLTSLSLSQVKELKAGNGERVPTLQEILSAASGHVGLILESITPGISLDIAQTVNQSKFQGHVIYSSFLHDDILALRNAHPGADTMALFEGIPVSGPRIALEAKARYVGVSTDSVTREFVSALRAADLGVFVYTPNTPWLIEYAKQLDVDGIISDFPDRIT